MATIQCCANSRESRSQAQDRARIAVPGGPGEKSRARSTGPGAGTEGEEPGKQGVRMEPLHLAIMRALLI